MSNINLKNLNIASIVTVRALSTRLEKKCFQKLYKQTSMLEIVIDRAKKVGHKVIVATTNNSSDDKIEEIAKKNSVDIFRGSILNKIHRWYSCQKEFDLDYMILIDADDPSFCFSLAHRALNSIVKYKKEITIGSKNLLPGLITNCFSSKGMYKLYKTAQNERIDTDVIDEFIKAADLDYFVIEPKNLHEHICNIRLTVDYEVDIKFYKALFKKISYLEESSKMISVIKKENLEKINWFKNQEYVNNQIKFNKKVVFNDK